MQFSHTGRHIGVHVCLYMHAFINVLSFLLMYSSSGLSTDVFFLIKRI